MVVVDHDSGRLVWAAPGRDSTTLQRFFDALGAERAARSATCPPTPRTGSRACATTLPERDVVLDPFHVVGWATEALDAVRRGVWNAPRKIGLPGQAAHSRVPATRCGRTPKTSPTARTPSWPGSPGTTSSSTAPTC